MTYLHDPITILLLLFRHFTCNYVNQMKSLALQIQERKNANCKLEASNQLKERALFHEYALF